MTVAESSEIHRVRIEVRQPRGSDPGAIEEGHYVVRNGDVTLTDKGGVPVDKYKFSRKLVEGGANAHILAAVMLRQWKRPKSGDFNRRLVYPKTGY